jgi:hypothetical protein
MQRWPGVHLWSLYDYSILKPVFLGSGVSSFPWVEFKECNWRSCCIHF